jgi:hypothetical protein
LPVKFDQFNLLVGVLLPSALKDLGDFIAIEDTDSQRGQIPPADFGIWIILRFARG